MFKPTLGQKLTIFSISEGMAHTMKDEILVSRVLDAPVEQLHYQNGPVTAHRVGAGKQRGKRKEFHLDIKLDALVFEGWDLPILNDWEVKRECGSTGFAGNACYNLNGPDADTIRDYIENRNLNGPTSHDTKAICLHITPQTAIGDDGELLYPLLGVRHGIIERIKDKRSVAA